jgi:hypothetical protein
MQQVLKAVHLTPSFNGHGRVFCIQRKFLFGSVYTSTHTDHLYGLSQPRNVFRHLEVLQGDQKSLCNLWLQYRKLQAMFKVSPASLQTFIDTRLTLTPSVIPNSNYVIMVSNWNCLKYFYVFLYCNHQVHRDFITLYIIRVEYLNTLINSFTDTPRKEYETQEHNVITGNMGFDLDFSWIQKYVPIRAVG